MIAFHPIPTEQVRHYQSGGADAYGMAPERRISDGDGVPCRHCLQDVPEGEAYLVLAHRPFAALQPYAETGPIFLCADPCAPAKASDALPPILTSQSYILRGYSPDHRIVYGTGRAVATGQLVSDAAALLERPDVAYAHVRSAANNCFQVAVMKA